MRMSSAVLIGVSVLSLAACGGDETPTAAAPTTAPAATTTATEAAPDPAATSVAAAPAAGGAATDKQLCAAANKADKSMKAELIKAMQAGGEPDAAVFKKVLDGLAGQLNTAAAGSDSKVAVAMKDFAGRAGEAAAAADPVTASDTPAFEQSGKDLTAACKAAGVKVNY